MRMTVIDPARRERKIRQEMRIERRMREKGDPLRKTYRKSRGRFVRCDIPCEWVNNRIVKQHS
jgi:hypothetical protein